MPHPSSACFPLFFLVGLWPFALRADKDVPPASSASKPTTASSSSLPSQEPRWIEEARRLEAKGRETEALERLNEGRRRFPDDLGIRRALADLWVRLGDAAGKKKDLKKQREMYQKALEEDPRLLDDTAFFGKYRWLQREKSGLQDTPTYTFKTKRVIRLGVGLTGGIEGIGGLQVSILLWGLLQPLATFAPGSPTLDLSFRVIALRGAAWSPYIGGGVMLPLRAWFGLTTEILPEAVLHLDLGVHFLAPNGFSFSGGLSFCYNLDPKGLWSFLPLPSLQIAWFF